MEEKRRSWTILVLLLCEKYKSTHYNSTFDVWGERNPKLLPTMHNEKLSNQQRSVQKILSEDEMIEIGWSAQEYINTGGTIDERKPPTSTPPPTPPITPDSSPKTAESEEERDTINNYYEEITVIFEIYQTVLITERKKPNTFPLTK